MWMYTLLFILWSVICCTDVWNKVVFASSPLTADFRSHCSSWANKTATCIAYRITGTPAVICVSPLCLRFLLLPVSPNFITFINTAAFNLLTCTGCRVQHKIWQRLRRETLVNKNHVSVTAPCVRYTANEGMITTFFRQVYFNNIINKSSLLNPRKDYQRWTLSEIKKIRKYESRKV